MALSPAAYGEAALRTIEEGDTSKQRAPANSSSKIIAWNTKTGAVDCFHPKVVFNREKSETQRTAAAFHVAQISDWADDATAG
jgi:hypothetical protein